MSDETSAARSVQERVLAILRPFQDESSDEPVVPDSCERCAANGITRSARFTVAGCYQVCGAHIEWALQDIGFASLATTPTLLAARNRVNG